MSGKKILQTENPPPPTPTFLMVRPLTRIATNDCWKQESILPEIQFANFENYSSDSDHEAEKKKTV